MLQLKLTKYLLSTKSHMDFGSFIDGTKENEVKEEKVRERKRV